jgi:hypothetical protein
LPNIDQEPPTPSIVLALPPAMAWNAVSLQADWHASIAAPGRAQLSVVDVTPLTVHQRSADANSLHVIHHLVLLMLMCLLV